jgi:RNA polymerase sigma factor (sigma-70 family)
MTARPDRMLQHIRRLVSRPACGPDTDAFLLERFARRGDEAAFTALVERYGRLVFSVCRRVLGDVSAAEDCTQAAFLVLARKAATIRRAEELPAWLHGTAYRLALRARRADLRRLHRETRSARVPRQSPPADPLDELTARELLLVLDEELQRLPEAYRLPLILCGLEGLSQEEAAARLGWSPGSVKGRLERGRARLHTRLKRRGLALATALGAVELTRSAASAALSAALTGPTVRTALAFMADKTAVADRLSPQVIALAEGALKAMSLSKMKIVLAGFVIVGLAGTGLGWLGTGAGKGGLAGTPSATAAPPGEKPPPAATADKDERKRRDEQIIRARKELQLVASDAERADRDLSMVVVEARQRLVEWEERLRAAEAEPQPPRPTAEEARLLKEETLLENDIARRKEVLVPETAAKILEPVQKQLDRIRRRLDGVKKKRAMVREKIADELIAIRKQIVRLEEDIHQLERKRTNVREEAERRRDEATERLRRLEGGEGAAAAPDRSLRALERRLKSIEGEITELRQEIRKLRSERKR